MSTALHASGSAEPARPAMAEIVTAARAGDQRAWATLVRRSEPMLRSVARRYGLAPAQIDDVLQTAWLRLFERFDALRRPEAVGAWLAVTVRRESFRVLQGQVREHLTDDPLAGEQEDSDGPEAAALRSERRTALDRAIQTLPVRHGRLMRAMLHEPGLDYGVVSARTGIPMGSIGPIRGRCLRRMAAHPEIQALRD